MDCVGGSFWKQNLKVLSVEGTWIVYGLLGGGKKLLVVLFHARYFLLKSFGRCAIVFVIRLTSPDISQDVSHVSISAPAILCQVMSLHRHYHNHISISSHLGLIH